MATLQENPILKQLADLQLQLSMVESGTSKQKILNQISALQGMLPAFEKMNPGTYQPAPTSFQQPGTPVTPAAAPVDPRRQRSDQIKEIARGSSDVQQLIKIYRGQYNNETGGLAHETNAVAGDRIAELTGIDRNILSSMHDDEIIGAYQGNQEKKKIEDLAGQQQTQINKFADEFAGRAKSYRDRLAESLAGTNQKAFQLANPYILEDLNSRGLFSSESAINSAQAEALKDLELDRQNKLIGFDTGAFSEEQDLRSGGLSAFLGGQQSALDAALNARRSGLERAYQTIDTQNESSLASSLAKKQRRNQLYGSLIGAGATIGSRFIPGGGW